MPTHMQTLEEPTECMEAQILCGGSYDNLLNA